LKPIPAIKKPFSQVLVDYVGPLPKQDQLIITC